MTAIICEKMRYLSGLQIWLNKIKIPHQSIQEFLTTKDQSKFILDASENAASFEIQTVLFIEKNYYDTFGAYPVAHVGLSRARSQLIIYNINHMKNIEDRVVRYKKLFPNALLHAYEEVESEDGEISLQDVSDQYIGSPSTNNQSPSSDHDSDNDSVQEEEAEENDQSIQTAASAYESTVSDEHA